VKIANRPEAPEADSSTMCDVWRLCSLHTHALNDIYPETSRENEMAGEPVINLGENSAEYVAYKLMRDIAHAEKIVLQGMSINSTREWILKTYAQCLQTVRSPHLIGDILG
jgi:hypothetical protein